jgi:DNA gyrase subunit B
MSMKMTPVEHVRKRPGMYFGTSGDNLLHIMLLACLDDFTKYFFEDNCHTLMIRLLPGSFFEFQATGISLPDEIEADTPVPFLETLMTSYIPSERNYGTHGAGLVAINALAQEMTAKIVYQDEVWQQSYQKGIPQTSVAKISLPYSINDASLTIRFKPDFTIVPSPFIDFENLINRCHEIAYLCRGLTIEIRDSHENELRILSFHSPQGLTDAILELTHGNELLHDILHLKKQFELDGEVIWIECAFVFTDGNESIVKTFDYTFPVPRGTHLWGMRSALVGILERWIYTEEQSLTWQDVSPGFIGIIQLYHPTITYSGCTRQQISNPELFGWVADWIYQECHKLDWLFFKEVEDRIRDFISPVEEAYPTEAD